MALRKSNDDGGKYAMKYQHLERFRITLETVSPVFIGSSAKISKKELVMLPNEGKVLIPNLNKLISILAEKNSLNAYEEYLVDETNRKSLRNFLSEQCIPVSANAPWVQNCLYCSSNDIRNINVLHQFIKDNQGNPYIPGSSIKGAIRTALLAYLSSERDIHSVKDSTVQNIRQRKQGIEEYPLRTLKLNAKQGKEKDAVNDLLRSLQISDSSPFNQDSLVICKKLELTKDGKVKGIDNGRNSSPPLYRECLRPGLMTHFYLTIDKNLARDEISIQIIKDALKQWIKIQNDYVNRFDQWGLNLKGLEGSNIPIVLGGGVGFQSKSLLMKLKEDRDNTIHFILKNTFKGRYKNSPDDPGPYRMKLAQYNGAFYPMGRCSLTVEE